MLYRVVDNISGEILEFKDQMDAEMIAERRLSRYKSGFDIRRNHFSPISNAIIKVNKEDYIICLKK